MEETGRSIEDGADDHAETEEDVTETIERLRRQLEDMKRQREEYIQLHQMELKDVTATYEAKKKQLHQKLHSRQQLRSDQAMFMKFLKHEYYQLEQAKKQQQQQQASEARGKKSQAGPSISEQAPSSMYILQQETPLLATMHRSFLLLPKQIAITKACYETQIYPYLQNELRTLQHDLDTTSHRLIDQVTFVAQDNHNIYDRYQQQVKEQESLIRELKKQVQQQSPLHIAKSKTIDSDLNSSNNSDDDQEEDLLSSTEHSLSSTVHNDDDSSRGENDNDDDDSDDDGDCKSPSRFITVTKLWSPDRFADSISSNLNNIRTAAVGRFQLPFGN
jgi:hypothetical protein